MIARSDRMSQELLDRFKEFQRFAWICFDPRVIGVEYEINTIGDAHRLLIKKEHHNFIKLGKEPFTYVLSGSKEDWILYGLQPVFFIVSDIKKENRWYQPIRDFYFEVSEDPYWVTEDIEEAICYSQRLGSCPNCCPDNSPWPGAAIAVPLDEIARHFLSVGWDKNIVDEVILGKEVDWFKQGSLPLDKEK